MASTSTYSPNGRPGAGLAAGGKRKHRVYTGAFRAPVYTGAPGRLDHPVSPALVPLCSPGWLLLAVAPSVAPLLVAAVAVSPSPCRRLLVDAVASAGVVNAVV
jgi:hypothetical protein